MNLNARNNLREKNAMREDIRDWCTHLCENLPRDGPLCQKNECPLFKHVSLAPDYAAR